VTARRGRRGAEDEPLRVFVYGTLLAGERNHHLLAGARLLGTTRTHRGYSLHDLGHFPGLVGGGQQAVTGEIYEIDEPTLAALDRLEGHPSFYHRTLIIAENGACVIVYLLAPSQVVGYPVIASGNWRDR
jgi:gamma-glutamylaminecyclotransferase